MNRFLATVPGVFQITDSLAAGKRHLQVALYARRGGGGPDSGRSRSAAASQFHGVEAQRIQRGHEEIKVMVRYPPETTTESAGTGQ